MSNYYIGTPTEGIVLSPIPKLRKQTGPKKLRVSSKQHSRNRYGW